MLLEIPAHFGRKQMRRNFSESAFGEGRSGRIWIRKKLEKEWRV